MLITHTVDQALTVCTVIDNLQCSVLCHHLGKGLCDLILVAFFHCLKSLICIWCGKYSLWIKDRIRLGCKAVTGLYTAKLSNGTDIPCKKLRNFDRFGTFHDIKLVYTLLCSLLYIKKCIIGFQHTGAYLDQRIFTKERIRDSLKYIGGFCLGKVIIGLKDLVSLLCDTIAGTSAWAWEVTADIIQKVRYTAKVHR